MVKSKSKFVSHHGNLEEAISWLNELEELGNDIREIVDNASGTNFENTARIQTLSDTADAIEGLDLSPDVPSTLDDVLVSWMSEAPPKRGLSRASRRDNAISGIQAAIDALGDIADATEPEEKDHLDPDDWADAQKTWAEEEEKRNDADALRDTLQEIVDEAEGLEFPGMYG